MLVTGGGAWVRRDPGIAAGCSDLWPALSGAGRTSVLFPPVSMAVKWADDPQQETMNIEGEESAKSFQT